MPANARPTFGPTGGRDGHAFFGQTDTGGPAIPFGPRVADFGRYLRREGDICLVRARIPNFASDSGDWEWKFEDHKIMRGRGMFAHIRRRLFLGGDQSYLSAKFEGCEDVGCSLNTAWDDWSARADQAQPGVPAPGAIVLGSIGAALVGWLRRRRTL